MATPPRQQMQAIDSSSRIEPLNYEFPASIIDQAKGVTLADLLDNPATQCWIISALSNGSTYASVFMSEMQPKDSHMMLLIQAVLDQIPMHERQALFRTTSDLIRSRRQHG